MTNEQAKKEAIKKAYGNHYDIFKPNENGIGSAIGGIDKNKYETISSGYVNTYRPICLKGIENNNGWTRIEPDGSNLPTKGEFFKCILADTNQIIEYHRVVIFGLSKYGRITHYKPITPELKPIY